METTRSERIKLGIFMFLCLALIVAFLGYVLNRFISAEYDNYYTVFKGSVIGLYNEAKVKLNGIDVGNVTGIQIDSSSLDQVVVSFKVKHGTPIKPGTRAGLTNGLSLTGEKHIVLAGGSFSEPNLKEGGFVPAEASSFDKFADQAGGMVGKMDSLLSNFNSVFSAENAENIRLTLKNFANMSGNLSHMTKDLAKPIESISNAANAMQSVMSEIEEAKIAAKAGEDMDLLKSKLEAIDTKGINDNLMQAMESMNALTKRIDLMVYENQDQVGETMTNINNVLGNLDEFSQKIKNNPSVLIRSETKSRRQ